MSARSTFQTYLMKKGTGQSATYSKLIDIKEFPDLGKAPETLETTTLSDPAKTYIEGLKDPGQLSFPCNYDATEYASIKVLAGTECDLAVWFGATESNGVYTPSGSSGKFEFKGYVDVFVKGAGSNSVVEMEVVVTVTTDIVKASS